MLHINNEEQRNRYMALFPFDNFVLHVINAVGVPCIISFLLILGLILRLFSSTASKNEYELIDSSRLKGVIEGFVGSSHDNKTGGQRPRKARLLNESRMLRTVEAMFGKPFKKCRPEWLINPTTGRRLELDLFNEEIGIAFEYDGAQHHHYVPHYHASRDHFEYRQLLDKLKDRICKARGVVLVRIPHTVTEVDMSAYIRGALGYDLCTRLQLNP